MSDDIKIILRSDEELQNLPPGLRDPIGAKTILEVLYNLNAQFEKDGWDLPPAFGMLYQRGALDEGPLKGRAVEFMPIDGFERGYNAMNQRYGRPWPAIIAAAESLRQAYAEGVMEPPRTLMAVVMINEAWLMYRTGEEANSPEYERIVRERRIHEQPDRVEARMLTAADPQGVRYQLLQERDGIVQHSLYDPHGGPDQDLSHGAIGDVPNALHYFVLVATGQNPPDWPQFCQVYDYEAEIEKRVHRADGST